MKDTSVAARYAKALFIVTEKRAETARALEDLKGLLPVFAPKGRIYGVLISPQTRLADKRTALTHSLKGKVLPTVEVFIDLLMRRKRLAQFQTLVGDFEALVEQSLGLRRALVVSAVPLEAPEVKRLQSALEHYTHGHIRLSQEVDPALLGGALVRIGDRVVDRSVRTLLESIERQLYEVSV